MSKIPQDAFHQKTKNTENESWEESVSQDYKFQERIILYSFPVETTFSILADKHKPFSREKNKWRVPETHPAPNA